MNEQPAPKNNEYPATWHLVVEDMRARDQVGRQRYGTPLQPHNGRNSLQDAYEECLDLCVYLRNAMEEQRAGKELPSLRPSRDFLESEVKRLKERENELLDANTRLMTRVQELGNELNSWTVKSLPHSYSRHPAYAMRDLFRIADQVVGVVPRVPDDETVRFRMRLIAEEFLETVEAAFKSYSPEPWLFKSFKTELHKFIDLADVKVDLPKFVDGLADLDYVVEGARCSFGVDGAPIADEVHRKNMSKAGGPRRESDGKMLKPEGFTPPDVAKLLKDQGWIE